METTQPIFNVNSFRFDVHRTSYVRLLCALESESRLGKILTKYSHTSFLLLFVMHPASYKEVSVCSV